MANQDTHLAKGMGPRNVNLIDSVRGEGPELRTKQCRKEGIACLNYFSIWILKKYRCAV